MVNYLHRFIFYLNILTIIIKNNYCSQIQYRASIFIRFIGAFAELFLVIVFFKFLYNKISFIDGWDYSKILILICLFDIIRNLLLGCFIRNLPKIEDILINGNLDLYITKPIDAQFYVSFQQISLGHIAQIIVPLAILLYILISDPSIHVTAISLLILMINIMGGAIIGYSLWIFIMSFSFYVVKIKSLHEVFLNLLQIGKYPSSIYDTSFRLLFKFIFPILMIASFPAEIFFGFHSSLETFTLLGMAIVGFFFARLFWKRALVKYESAGG